MSLAAIVRHVRARTGLEVNAGQTRDGGLHFGLASRPLTQAERQACATAAVERSWPRG